MDDRRSDARRRVGELLVCGYPGAGVPDAAFLERVERRQIGGVALFARNLPTLESAHEIRAALDASGGEDLLIALDEEGGWVGRLPAPWPRLPSAMALAAAARERPQAVEAYAASLGRALRCLLGPTQNCAPVLDVNTAPENPVIGTRAFSDDPEVVARLGGAFAAGLEASGVAATGKHFPGHGATRVDSHWDLPALDADLERLRAVELLPFRAALAGGLSAIMTAHVALDRIAEAPGLPATLSRRVLTDLLRGEMGFDGVLITDCLEMQGITRGYGTPQAAVMAVAAGADQVLVSHTASLQEETHEALQRAVVDGLLSPERVLEAIARIERLRARHGPGPASSPAGIDEAVETLGGLAAALAAGSVYEAPTDGAERGHGAIDLWLVPAGDRPGHWDRVLRAAGDAATAQIGDRGRVVGVGPDGDAPLALPSGLTVGAVLPSLRQHPGWLALWQGLPKDRRVAVVIEDPYDAMHLGEARRVVVTPTAVPAAVASAVRVAMGLEPARGRAPVTLAADPGRRRSAASFAALEHRIEPGASGGPTQPRDGS